MRKPDQHSANTAMPALFSHILPLVSNTHPLPPSLGYLDASNPLPTNAPYRMNESTRHRYRVQDGHGLPHDPLPSIIGPRPIGWVSTCSSDHKFNLAPYSFFNIFNYRPPLVAFSSVGKKDSVRNIEATGEFVCNLATRALAEQVNLSSLERPEVDEFALTGLTPAPALEVSAPLVAESPVSLECKATGVQQLKALDGRTLDTWMVIGEIVAVHIERRLLKNGIYDTAAAGPIMRGGGKADYFEILPEGLFHMYRPK